VKSTTTKTAAIEMDGTAADEDRGTLLCGVRAGNKFVHRGCAFDPGNAVRLARIDGIAFSLLGILSLPPATDLTSDDRRAAVRRAFDHLEAERLAHGADPESWLKVRRHKKLYELVERELVAIAAEETTR
jgi:hypothetical protein